MYIKWLPLIFIKIELLHKSNICWLYYNAKQNTLLWMIQTQWFWAIVKRKRELLHEDIQSVLKFDFVTNYFNLKHIKKMINFMLLILFWLRTINLIPFQIHIEQNIFFKIFHCQYFCKEFHPLFRIDSLLTK